MLKSILTLGLAAGLLGSTALPAKADSLTDDQKKDIEKLMESYLMENGGTILQAIEKHQVEEQQRQLEQAKQNIKDNQDYLTASGSPSVGPQDADVTVVEFFDYNCGYCKRAFDEIQKILDEDKNVRVVFKELPILSPASREAAKFALAAQIQDKYFEFHAELMDFKGQKNEAAFKKIAGNLDLDFDKLKKDANSTAVEDIINKNLEMSRELGIRGTPAFIVGDEFSPGYLTYDQMKSVIAETRKNAG